MQYFDPRGRRLIYIEQAATQAFWDAHWTAGDFPALVRRRNPLVAKFTPRYLKPGARVLEGGCGRGDTVHTLREDGYDAHGIDFAPKTVEAINAAAPELQVQVGDVRAAPFPDGHFDGYWSLGVIEHFPEGYEAIARDMARVLRPGGILFLTFPAMSPLRRLKARLGLYPERLAPGEGFYQFALDPAAVEADFARFGFEPAARAPYDGIKGLKDEVGFLRPLLQPFYDRKVPGSGLILRALDLILRRQSYHMMLLVLRRAS